jgi:hypothetical protein
MRGRPVFSDHREISGQPGDGAVRGISNWHRALILGAVLSLTINVATRYCQVTGAETQTLKAAKSYSLDAQRQHLLNDGFHWSVPAAALVLFKPTQVISAVLPAIFPVTRRHSEVCLYNRPPPSCCASWL